MRVAIVGAGVLGRICALRLIAEQHQVSLFERGSLHQLSNAAFMSAGMIAPLGESPHAPAKVLQLGWQSLATWPALLAQLQQQDPLHADVLFQQRGTLVIAFPADRTSFSQWQQDLGATIPEDSEQVAWLDRNALLTMEPVLERFDRAAWLKADAQLCNREFLQASTRALLAHAQVDCDTALGTADIAQLASRFDWLIDCRGSGAIGQSDSQLPTPSLRGVRGEILRVRCPALSLTRPIRVIHPRYVFYLVPKRHHEIVVGATEIESSSDHPMTLRSALELMSTLYAVHPALAEAEILETGVAVRAAYPDNGPHLARYQNRIVANGLYRHGWLMGPALANAIMKILHGDRSAEPTAIQDQLNNKNRNNNTPNPNPNPNNTPNPNNNDTETTAGDNHVLHY